MIENAHCQNFSRQWVFANSIIHYFVDIDSHSSDYKRYFTSYPMQDLWTISDSCRGHNFTTNLNTIIDHNSNNQEIADSITGVRCIDCQYSGGVFRWPYNDSLYIVVSSNPEEYNYSNIDQFPTYGVFNANSVKSGAEPVILRGQNLGKIFANQLLVLNHFNQEDKWVIGRDRHGKAFVWAVDSLGINTVPQIFQLTPPFVEEPQRVFTSKLFSSMEERYIFYSTILDNNHYLSVAEFDSKKGIINEKYHIPLNSIYQGYNLTISDLVFLDSTNLLYMTLTYSTAGVFQLLLDKHFNLLDYQIIKNQALASADTLENFESGMSYNFINLGADEKIYIKNFGGNYWPYSLFDSAQTYLSVINNPHVFGSGCELNALSVGKNRNRIIHNGFDFPNSSSNSLEGNKNKVFDGECIGDSIFVAPVNLGCERFKSWNIIKPNNTVINSTNRVLGFYPELSGEYIINLYTDMDTLVMRRFISDIFFNSFEIDSTMCKGNLLEIDFGNQSINEVYQWEDGDVGTKKTISKSGNYKLVKYTGCSIDTFNFNVRYDTLEIKDAINKTEYCENEDVKLDLPEGNFEIEWLDGFVYTGKIEETGNYRAKFSGSCLDTIIVFNIQINEFDNSLKGINVFTPNGDGYNDLFKPYSENINSEGFSLTIYNRWGRKVFETRDPKIYWDGTNFSQGTYFYNLEYQNCDGQIEMYKSFLELMK